MDFEKKKEIRRSTCSFKSIYGEIKIQSITTKKISHAVTQSLIFDHGLFSLPLSTLQKSFESILKILSMHLAAYSARIPMPTHSGHAMVICTYSYTKFVIENDDCLGVIIFIFIVIVISS